MEIGIDLVWLVLHWMVTLAAAVLLFFAVSSLMSKRDPGALFVSNPTSLLSSDALIVVAMFASLVWFCSYGADGFFWAMPEFSDSNEGLSRSGAALLFGLIGAGAIHQLGIQINDLYWRQVGQREILADIKRNFGRFVELGPETRQQLAAIIAEIEDAKPSYETNTDRVSRERRVAFLKELRNLV